MFIIMFMEWLLRGGGGHQDIRIWSRRFGFLGGDFTWEREAVVVYRARLPGRCNSVLCYIMREDIGVVLYIYEIL